MEPIAPSLAAHSTGRARYISCVDPITMSGPCGPTVQCERLNDGQQDEPASNWSRAGSSSAQPSALIRPGVRANTKCGQASLLSSAAKLLFCKLARA